ncbi:MAG: glycosyltransferase family 4 protein [Gemmatimonadota bacterium]
MRHWGMGNGQSDFVMKDASVPRHNSTERNRGKVVYVCLQQTVEGQASYAHVHEIIRGLERLGWEIDLRQIRADRGRKHSRWYYLWHYLAPQLNLWRHPPASTAALYIRADALALPAFLWAWMKGIPVINEVNGPYSDRIVARPWLRPFSGLLAALQRFQYRRSSALIAVTPRLVEWLEQESPGTPIHLVPNGANTTLFSPAAVRPRPIPNRYVILFGLLARWQGVELLLSAIDRPEWPDGVRVLVAGSGELQGRVEQVAHSNSRIEYLGIVPYEEMPGLIAGSLAGLSIKTHVTGRTETGMSPLKLYETLSCGVPAIVTDYHGQSEIVAEYQCGRIVPQDDPRALAQAVAEIATNEAERRAMGDRGRNAVSALHSWDQRAAQVGRVIESANRLASRGGFRPAADDIRASQF